MQQRDPLALSADLMTRIQKGAFLTVKAGAAMNVMTIGWGLIGFIWQRPVFMAAVRNSRHTFSIIEQAADFTVCLPSGDMQKAINLCGTKSGRDMDKLKAAGLLAVPAQKTASPVLQAPGTHLECRILLKAPMNPSLLDPALEELYPAKDYHTLYFGEILACYEMP